MKAAWVSAEKKPEYLGRARNVSPDCRISVGLLSWNLPGASVETCIDSSTASDSLIVSRDGGVSPMDLMLQRLIED